MGRIRQVLALREVKYLPATLRDGLRFVLLFTSTAVSQRRKCESAPPGDDCMRSLTDDNGDVCPMQTHIKTHTRAKHTRTPRTFSYIHTHSQTHARMHASMRSRAHTHIHTQTHTCTQRHTHGHSYTIIFIYRMKCLTFYSLKI